MLHCLTCRKLGTQYRVVSAVAFFQSEMQHLPLHLDSHWWQVGCLYTGNGCTYTPLKGGISHI